MASLKHDSYDTYLSWRFELTKHRKRKRLLIVAALAIIVPLLFYISPADTARDFASNSLIFLTFLVILSGAMFTGDAISGEFEKKTALLLFPTPQRRTAIFTGKYLAALTATLMTVSIYYLIVTVQIVHLFGAGEIPGQLGKSYVTATLYSCSVVSIIYFFSSLFKKTLPSTLIGFFFLFMILPILAGILYSLDVNPWFMVTWPSQLITEVLDAANNGSSEGDKFKPHFGTGIAVMIVYAIAFFAAGTRIAGRKDMD